MLVNYGIGGSVVKFGPVLVAALPIASMSADVLLLIAVLRCRFECGMTW